MRIGRRGTSITRRAWSKDEAERVRNRTRRHGQIRWMGSDGQLFRDRKTAVRRGGGERADLRTPRLVVVQEDVELVA